MAEREHLSLLNKGVVAWNKWRRRDQLGSYTGPLPDLSGANLEGANLDGFDLFSAELSNSILNGASLVNAELAEVNFTGASLNQANLTGASMRRARFERASLVGINMTCAFLSRAIFSYANLEEANLFAANFDRAILWGANLRRATLRRSNLTDAQLSKANLSEADLRGAHLEWAVLSEANLSGADLRLAGLTSAVLTEVNFDDAFLGETVFADVDLAGAIGIDKCRHNGPSVIDHRALQKSGRLPLEFLRGIGLPDIWIEYASSLDTAIQYYSCFVSYSAKDRVFVKRLYTDLQNAGVRCWFAPHDMKIGDKIWDSIDQAIRLRDKVLLIISEDALRSDWVEDEVIKGFAEEKARNQTVIFPIRLDAGIMHTNEPWAVKLRDQRHIGNFADWQNVDAYRASLERLIRDLTVGK